ncbi:hypothetical protein [Mycolicibacterium llatzerense]|uniref:hypothetical protein n=1 Tax=Mycolicibacterium llatzerense TaxID=280871 RepID=UPI0021B68056|nr:hypothetical protein [Mycolicibacterium llatzerense]MCT7371883.1 hypothetical protein [Mycolicibacterium llatzerense]
MTTLTPVQWCLIAALSVLYAIHATWFFFHDEDLGWLAGVCLVGRYIMAFGLLYNLPAPPPFAVPITTGLVLAVLVIAKALRHMASRRDQCTCHTPLAGPPDIERIP